MGSPSSRWRRQGPLWIAHTRGRQSFLALPTGQKIAWFRGKGSRWGRLRVSGSRLDGGAPALRERIPASYPFREGFPVLCAFLSAPGCWRIVARIGLEARYVFVVRVEPD